MIKWEGDIEKRRIELLNEGHSYDQIAEILSGEFNLDVGYWAVQGRCRTTNTRKTDLQKEKIINGFESKAIFTDDLLHNDEDMLYKKVKEKLAQLHSKYGKMKIKKILVLSDLHAPFTNFRAVNHAIEENSDADLLVLNGDVFDLYAFSRFDKWSEIDINRELDCIRKLFQELFKKFKHIIWVGGNHDLGRFRSFLMKAVPTSLRGFFDEHCDPRKVIQRDFKDYDLEIVDHNFIQIGDIVFAHLDDFSSVAMKSVTSVSEVLSASKMLLPTGNNFNAVVIGHTHHIGKIIVNDRLMIEQGACCHLMDYRVAKPTKSAWSTGYAVMYLDKNMNVDYNKSNFVYLKDI